MIKLTIPRDYTAVTLKEADLYSTSRNDTERLCAFGNAKEDVLKVNASVVKQLVAKLNEMMATELYSDTTRFTHNGVEYAMHPDFHKLPYGDYIDAQNALEKLEGNYNYLATVLFRRVTIDAGKWYEVSDERPSLKELQDLPVIYLNGAFGFFLQKMDSYENSISNYLLNQTTRLTRRAKSLLKNGDTTRQFTTWLRGIFSKSAK